MFISLVGTGLVSCKNESYQTTHNGRPPSVSASSGPLRITLHLLTDEIKRGETFWYKLELKNISDGRLIVSRREFLDPWKLADNQNVGLDTFIEIVDDSGKVIDADLFLPYGPGELDYRSEAFDKIVGTMTEGHSKLSTELKGKGSSQGEIDARLEQYMSELNRKARRAEDRENRIRLPPGGVLHTRPWHYKNHVRKRDGWIPPPSSEDYAELAVYPFLRQGKYRLRAVYSNSIDFSNRIDRLREISQNHPEVVEKIEGHWESMRTLHDRDDVRIETDWIEISVR